MRFILSTVNPFKSEFLLSLSSQSPHLMPKSILLIFCICYSLLSFAQPDVPPAPPKKCRLFQRKPKVVFVTPEIPPQEETPTSTVDEGLQPPNVLSITDNESDAFANMPVGEVISDEEIIRQLNVPLLLDTFPLPIQKIVRSADKLVKEEIGEENMRKYVRINKQTIYSMTYSWYKVGFNAFTQEYGLQVSYEVVYDGYLAGSINIKTDTDGKILPQHAAITRNALLAYRELFEGKLKVRPSQVLEIVFGNRKPNEVYHLYLYHKSGRTPYTQLPPIATYQRPEIYWFIWQNGCTYCKEAEIDAQNADNRNVGTVKRKW